MALTVLGLLETGNYLEKLTHYADRHKVASYILNAEQKHLGCKIL